MIELYPNFQHLKSFNNIFVYSDPHFSTPAAEEPRKDYIGDEEQIKRINSKVGKKDVIIFLGDIGNIESIKKIRGYKILIMGNHDSGATNYQRRTTVDTAWNGTKEIKFYTDNHLFDEVYTGIVALNDKILLSHEPVFLPFMFNIHGHDHSNKEGANDNLHLNVCAEHINYTPINLNTLLKQGKFKDVPNIHRLTINKAVARKKQKLV